MLIGYLEFKEFVLKYDIIFLKDILNISGRNVYLTKIIINSVFYSVG